MAHYAKLDEENNVIRVNVVNNSDCLNADGIEDEEVGRQFLERIHNWPLWKKTSYNTKRGQYFELDEEGVPVLAEDQSKHDLFTIKKPFPSWTLNTTSGIWESPVAEPTLSIPDHEQGFRYQWNESLGQWEKVQ